MRRLITTAALALLMMTSAASAATITLDTTACNNTCFGWTEGDNTPDIFGIFGPPLSQVMGHIELTFDSLLLNVITVNGHALPQGVTATLSFTNPLLASFAEGSAMFTAIGPPNMWGFVPREVEFLCPEPFTPGVPEPSTWALLLLGFAGLGFIMQRRQKRGGYDSGWAVVGSSHHRKLACGPPAS